MPLTFVAQDITKMAVDAVVNAANSRLAPGGGVCSAIFAAAGYDRLDRACRAIGGCSTGEAVITDGFDLPARFVIHAVGPIWTGGNCGEEEQLRSCYRNALELACRHGCISIAFPLISSGIYGYPKEQALTVAVSAIRSFLEDQDIQVSLSLFGRELIDLSKRLFPEL